MAKIVGVANQKGGVGKTTTAVNLSASLALLGQKTLLVDLDPQGNSSSGMGVDRNRTGNTVYDVLVGRASAVDSMLKVHPDSFGDMLYVLPANPDLTGAEVEILTVEDRERILKNSLSEVSGDFSYIIIDCPPSLNILSINALAAADSAIIPIRCEYYALEGLARIRQTVSAIQRQVNPSLRVEGYLLTMFDPRNNICHSVVRETRNHFGDSAFRTAISRNVRLAECPSHGKPLAIYDRNSQGARDYMSLAEEIIKNNGGVPN